MQDLDDLMLLHEYATRDSEAAFAELVSRRVGFVYSAALRQVRDPHLAEEITQAVFIILAQKAGRISNKTILAGWLFKTTRYAAIAQTRDRAKRSLRRATIEKEFQMRSEIQSAATDEIWYQISPLLDEALESLGEKDRQAVLLRFFENKSLAEVGSHLGTGEDTARKRVSRALEKLLRYFNKRGVSLTTAMIAGAMAANSVQAAPVALAKTVTAVAIAKGAAASGSTIALIKGVLKIMAWTKAKTAIVVGVVTLLAAGTTTVTIKEIQKHKTYSWEVPRASFDVLYKTPPQVMVVPTKFSEDGGTVGSNDRVLGIAQPINEIVQAAYGKGRFRTVIASELPEDKYDYIANLPDGAGSGKALEAEIKRLFNLVGKLEQRETDVLVLKIANGHVNGFKPTNSLRQNLHQTNSATYSPAVMSGFGLFVGFDQPTSTLTPFLESRFRIPVIDQTGLSKRYDFYLKWDEKDRDHLNVGGLQQALLDQLGLELVPSRELIEMLVVEKVK